MVRKHINELIGELAYIAYTKKYGIHDKPFQKVAIHLSEKDNKLNAIALSSSTPVERNASITLRSNEEVRLSDEDNEWNKLATKQK